MSGFFAHQLSLGRKYSILAEVCCDAKALNRQKQTNGLFGVKTVIFTKKQAISHKNLRNMHQNAMLSPTKRSANSC
jgi:hypothetical protein